ncbi:MAG: ABC transporter ATP-binding protein [Endomicrobium sp.]|jgi:iron complex transport system ATP-binding protein|nr:ABC transporter ATP-binding protein [Endomicrobium sp.]
MIRIENVSAGYLNKKILKNISFNIDNKDFFGIIGKNGTGKSTLLKVICNLIKAYAGNIFINNKNINLFSIKDLAKIIAFLPQHVDTSMSFTVAEFIMLGRYSHMNIFKIPSTYDYIKVKEIINFFQIENLTNKKINELSYGEKQKVLIAQVLVQETNIIVFDEPTSHLDIGNQNNILKILRNLNEKYNKTIILTLHDLNIASEFCNKILLIDNGSICRCGIPEEVLNYKDIEKIYKTMVVIKINPISNKPYVIPISKSKI